MRMLSPSEHGFAQVTTTCQTSAKMGQNLLKVKSFFQIFN